MLSKLSLHCIVQRIRPQKVLNTDRLFCEMLFSLNLLSPYMQNSETLRAISIANEEVIFTYFILLLV